MQLFVSIISHTNIAKFTKTNNNKIWYYLDLINKAQDAYLHDFFPNTFEIKFREEFVEVKFKRTFLDASLKQ